MQTWLNHRGVLDTKKERRMLFRGNGHSRNRISLRQDFLIRTLTRGASAALPFQSYVAVDGDL